MTTVFVIEEHNDAYFVWNYAVVNRVIPERRNTLLHVDDHADMHVPALETSIKEISQNLKDILRFTRNQLSISDFIVPAVYQGIFNEIYWMRLGRKVLDKEQFLNVVSHQGEGRNLIVTDNFLLAGMFNPDRRGATFRQINIEDLIQPSGPVVLDIDLDYFGCDARAGESWEVQVAEEEYRRFFDEPHHRLRLKFGGKLQAKARDGKFYFLYRPISDRVVPTLEREKIAARIDRFVGWLKKSQVQPALIDICRSRFSGYTPAAHWQWIEEQLVEKLKDLFPVTIQHLSELSGRQL